MTTRWFSLRILRRPAYRTMKCMKTMKNAAYRITA